MIGQFGVTRCNIMKDVNAYKDAHVRIFCTDPNCNFHITPDLSSHDIKKYSRTRKNMMSVIKNFFPETFYEGFAHFSKNDHELAIEFY